MSKSKIALKFSQARHTYTQAAIVQHHIASKLMDFLDEIKIPTNQTILEIGCGTGILSRQIRAKLEPKFLYLNDISPLMAETLGDLLGENVQFIAQDAEYIGFEKKVNLIASSSVFQWFDNPQVFLKKCVRLLEKNGLLLFSTFGPRNVWQIGQTSKEGLTYYPLEKWTEWLKQDYQILFTYEEEITIDFETPFEILRHLKNTGVNSVTQQQWTKGKLLEFVNTYAQNFTQNGKVKLTYHPIYCIARKR